MPLSWLMGVAWEDSVLLTDDWLQGIVAYPFMPLSWLMGVAWEDCVLLTDVWL